MQLCEQCLSSLAKELRLEEQAAIVYILASQKEAAETKKEFSGITSESLKKALRTTYSARTVLDFLCRLGIIVKKKTDHTYKFRLSRSGQKIGTLILGDEQTRAKVNAFFLIGKKGD